MDVVALPAGGGSLPVLASALIPGEFRHGFTFRAGGVSAGPFASLNVGMRWGDDPANVIENRRRVLSASGAEVMHFVSQVHGARVARVAAGDNPTATARQEADAVCAEAAGVAVAVFVADCVPALIADPRTRAFAAVHAGWRGTVADVLGETVAALGRAYGSRPDELRVALGPAIGPCCFEVGHEVAEQFQRLLPGDAGVVVARPGSKPHVDLRLAQRLLLARAGVPESSVDAGAECTRCDPAGRFFSYRRDAGRTGQHLGFICARR